MGKPIVTTNSFETRDRATKLRVYQAINTKKPTLIVQLSSFGENLSIGLDSEQVDSLSRCIQKFMAEM